MATQHDSPLYRSVYAAALVDALRADAEALNTTVCGAADHGDLFASAHEAAQTLAEKAVAQRLADRGVPLAAGTVEEVRSLVLRFCAGLYLADHLGDVARDVVALLQRLGVDGFSAHSDDLEQVSRKLRAMGVESTMRGGSLAADEEG